MLQNHIVRCFSLVRGMKDQATQKQLVRLFRSIQNVEYGGFIKICNSYV